MIILSQSDRDRMKLLESYYARLDNSYLRDVKDPQTAFIFEKFFPAFAKGGNVAPDPKKDIRNTQVNTTFDRLALLNVSMSIPYTVASIYSDYVGDPSTPYTIQIERQKLSYSWGGMGIFVVRKNANGEGVVDYLEPYSFVKYSEEDQAIYYMYSTKSQEKSSGDIFVLEQRYRKTDGGTVTKENTLFRVDSNMLSAGDLHGEKVPLSSVPETAGLEPIENIPIKTIPIVTVMNEVISGDTYGTSDILKIESLISSIEIQVVNIQDQFLKHLSAKLAVPASKLPIDRHTGLVDVTNLEVIGVEAGEINPAYILNQNPMITYAFDQIELLIKQLATIVRIPYEFFPVSTKGGAESADAKEIRISNFMKRVTTIRNKFTAGIVRVNAILSELGVNDAPTADGLSPSWGEVFPKDKHKLALEQQVAIESGFLSQKRAIMRYLEVSEQEAEQEIQTIRLEKSLSLQEKNSDPNMINNQQQ